MTNAKLFSVLSLFDGMSCGQLALRRAGIGYGRYFASEINKDAIKVTQTNFPDTCQLGDVTTVSSKNLPEIDLLIGGSPCQGFSFAGKQLNFEDHRSKLFFEYVRLLKEVKPKFFLLENVVMKKEYEDIISSYLGVAPVIINSSLVSAQNRKRLYWANFEISELSDRHIMLSDILESNVSNVSSVPGAIRGRYMLNRASIVGSRLTPMAVRSDSNKDLPITQCLEVRATNMNKSNCLTTADKDNVLTDLPPGRYPDAFRNKLPFRYYSLKECCRLQNVPDNYFASIVSTSSAKKMLGNGWTVDVIAHILACIPRIAK